jgi:hypothetical protein
LRRADAAHYVTPPFMPPIFSALRDAMSRAACARRATRRAAHADALPRALLIDAVPICRPLFCFHFDTFIATLRHFH